MLKNSGFNIEFSEESIKNNIQTIKNIYSAMYKYSKDSNSSFKVYRGTVKEEAENLKNQDRYNRLLSTSVSINSASRFASNHLDSPAIFTIDVSEDAPFINISRVLNEPEVESEILISPFCQIENLTHSFDQNGISNYSLKICKPDFKSIQENIDLSESDIVQKYMNLNTFSIEYVKLRNEKEHLLTLKNNCTSEKDLESLQNQIETADSKLKELSENISSINKDTQNYFMTSFKEIELNVDKEFKDEFIPQNISALKKRKRSLYNSNKFNAFVYI